MISRNTDKAKAQAKLRAQPVRWERMSQHTASDSRAGTYVLRTRHSDSEVLRLAESYWRPIEVDATFRGLKGEIGLRPSWHMKQDRIRAHLFIAVLAYHGVHLLRTLQQRQGIHIIWAWIRNRLAGRIRVTTAIKTNAGELIRIRQDRHAYPGAQSSPGRSAWNRGCTASGGGRGSRSLRRTEARTVAF